MSDVSELKIRSNTYTIKDSVARETKLDIEQGTAYAGKYLWVNSEGKIVPYSRQISVSFENITGNPEDNDNLKTALDKKVSKIEGSVDFNIGYDGTGLYVER